MRFQSFRKLSPERVVLHASAICLAVCLPQVSTAQPIRTTSSPAHAIISLVRDQQEPQVQVRGEASFANSPDNFHAFNSVHAGEVANIEKLTLKFSAATKLTKIESTKDFVIEQGSSCVVGRAFAENETCALLVRFNPQGAGRRLGKLKIEHTASAEPFTVGLGGNGYAPVVSFTPALVSLVSSTYSSGGVLKSAQNLAVDGGDILYVADTGNDLVREIDSSGTMTNITPVFSNPVSIAVDTYGTIWALAAPGSTYYFTYLIPYGTQSAYGTTYAPGACTPSTPCALGTVGMGRPGEISIDSNNNLFMKEATKGVLEMPVGGVLGGSGLNLWYLTNEFTNATTGSTFAVDSYGDPYTTYYNSSTGLCEIIEEPLYGAEYGSPTYNRVAGGSQCGFSGDLGQARGAEIGTAIGQITFDVAGNLYFSDTNNQRVRRIDTVTGIINTIAGNGSAGSNGNGGPATSLHLSYPTGVAVDSQGQVYIISELNSTPSIPQIIWKLGPNGMLSFPSTNKSTSSAAMPVTVANTGNSTLTLTNVVINGTNPSDFSIDPNTTSCMLTAGSTLNSGQSCKIGIIFKPSAVGSRTANLVMLDNTVTNSNVVQLVGTGGLPSPTFSITSPASGASVAAGTATTFKVSVTSSGSPAPTGNVTMKLDGAAISGSPATISSGAAQLSVTTSATGSHTLSATYNGDANFAAAGPITVSYTVTASNKVPAKVALKASANPASVCSAVSFTATVTSSKDGTPTGTIQFMNGAQMLGSASVKSGKAKFSTKALPAGTNMVTAMYQGDTKHASSVSTKLKEVVKGSSKSNSCTTK